MEGQHIARLENVIFIQVVPLTDFTEIDLVPPADIPKIVTFSDCIVDLDFRGVRLFNQCTSCLFLGRLFNRFFCRYFGRFLAGLAPPLRDIEAPPRPDNIAPAELIPNSQLIFCYPETLTYTPEAIA